MAITANTRDRLNHSLCDDAATNNLLSRNGVAAASLTVGAEAANVITVAVQLNDENGDAIASPSGVTICLFADAAGAGLNAQNYTTVAAGTDGWAIELVADKVLLAGSESDGDIDIAITLSSGAATCYVGVLLADGSWAISDAVTHAA
ncbi:MAG: hypothetical protein HOG19_05720 [Gammaproteobacteria bacterium]|jgi:hypothetical protein|nr:hypothetical protein [Gammaproteobacteria bacterium]